MLSLLLSIGLASNLSFGSPVNYPISLAGNFGEPRPNHFHGGIDVRTGMTVGKPLFSVADGYVSRITVGIGGFGNALYITHPGGVTSMYCHLEKFVPQLAAYVKKWQYKHQRYDADVRLRPTDFPVSKGQFVAVSGNTGASRAPHLHLEFHDTRTGDMLDPLTYLRGFVSDRMKPIAHSFMAYPVEGEGVFCGSQRKQSYGFSSTNLTRKFTAWGKVGFGIWANDYMEGSFGILGIRKTTLSVDGRVVFESNIDRIPVSYNRMVNSWGDYNHYCQSNVWYMKSFIEPGNKLPILNANGRRGIVCFDKEKEYHIIYKISDVFGNSREYSFTVEGKRQTMPKKKAGSMMNTLRYDRTNILQRPGLMLRIPKGLLPCDVEINPKANIGSNGLSDSWNFYNRSYPIFGWADISLKLKKEVQDPSKLYIISHFGVDRYMGGTYKNGWVKARMRELGARYEIGYDDTPPVISGFNYSNSTLRVAVYDAKSGLKGLKGYIDGAFVLFEPVEKTNMFACRLKASPVNRTGGVRRFKLVVTDNRDNKREFTSNIKY